MSLSPRAIALQGIGLTPLAVALQGLVVAVGVQPAPPIFGGFSNRPWRDAPFLPVRPRRPRRQRQEELVFLGH